MLVPWGIDLPMSVGAIAMSASTIVAGRNTPASLTSLSAAATSRRAQRRVASRMTSIGVRCARSRESVGDRTPDDPFGPGNDRDSAGEGQRTPIRGPGRDRDPAFEGGGCSPMTSSKAAVRRAMAPLRVGRACRLSDGNCRRDA